MTNEYDSNFPNDFNSRMVQTQNNKDFGLIQATLLDNHNLCSQNQISTPPTSPFLYASYESSLSCDTSFSSCSSSSLSPILTPTTSYPTLNSNPSLPTSPLEISLVKMEQDYEHSNDLSSHLYNNPLVQKQISITTSNELLSYEQYNNNNNIKDNAFNIKTTTYIQNINNQQLNQQIQYYIKEQSRILSLIEIQQQQYLKCKEFNDEQYKIDPEFLNSNLNLFKWTFIKPKFPLLFDQMYDKANGCFFLTGIPVEFIFDLCKHDNQQDLLTEDFLPFDNSNNEL
ncbi:uncharacterized protein OCT59_020363 [Rhizophagus irregularis]|uniref:Uncharacterized protein n=3 Tax=Rhizophagus irregularis TaxID=588596 RepID=A0A015IPU9_RHIIW|nr:hypothetical protein GLOIN_2v1520041 [Rhizophagus irregularis DAOM 181602=DAOM 197198]EXX56275.1 hypothetical protein RirG_217800 [Rhizophagus irregularis DAOM 197198w]UZO01854.1 hypothetical protein OCT59_020363 [Rhizophagus irregularis]POG80272.1 hypothetical protein GLOIN_2v1520041 [Rhizophagus irregularis DAOM 181602=DAOM 197198]CAG8565354.1 16219_t:CDS:1 [Rhizophagus irregularis]GBC26070.1 hypothetical protein GLOIN_2v1520041 [Rhizophagus irregularis DAOM 181602=DAOM 197198]|eukprot:XP_025187138.1 hypothetical protein GLOIN_2v1520041 [Rhizophagus irregularis DAOM 181602=DAOM 197198]